MIQSWSIKLFSFVLSAMFVASILAVPQPAVAGGGFQVPITDDATDRLIGYWDLRDRDTYFQVTNTSGQASEIHIQIFNASTGCAEFDYVDTLTPRDTHLYSIAELDRNNGVALSPPDLSGGHGIIAISEVDDENILTGNFRIIDDAGYEYRTNLAGEGFNDSDDYRVNFNNVDGASFADLVLITYTTNGDSDTITPVDALVTDITLYDENENPISCPDTQFSCVDDVINVGINQAITNSRGGPSLCLGNDTTGFVELDNIQPDTDDEGAIFIGLNNGSSTGSMDHGTSD